MDKYVMYFKYLTDSSQSMSRVYLNGSSVPPPTQHHHDYDQDYYHISILPMLAQS